MTSQIVCSLGQLTVGQLTVGQLTVEIIRIGLEPD
jgi:hypothetical protein